jgi:hypothetical protein
MYSWMQRSEDVVQVMVEEEKVVSAAAAEEEKDEYVEKVSLCLTSCTASARPSPFRSTLWTVD